MNTLSIAFIIGAVLTRAIGYIANRIEHAVIYSLGQQNNPEYKIHPIIEWWHKKTILGIKGIHKSGHIMHTADHISLFLALMAGLHVLGWKAWIVCAILAFFSRWLGSPSQAYINLAFEDPPFDTIRIFKAIIAVVVISATIAVLAMTTIVV